MRELRSADAPHAWSAMVVERGSHLLPQEVSLPDADHSHALRRAARAVRSWLDHLYISPNPAAIHPRSSLHWDPRRDRAKVSECRYFLSRMQRLSLQVFLRIALRWSR